MDEKLFNQINKEVDKSFNATLENVNDIFNICDQTLMKKDMQEEFNESIKMIWDHLKKKFIRIKKFHNGEEQKKVVKKYEVFIKFIRSHFPEGTDLVGQSLKFDWDPCIPYPSNIWDQHLINKELNAHMSNVIEYLYQPGCKTPYSLKWKCVFTEFENNQTYRM